MREFKFRAWDGKRMIPFSFDNIYGYEGEVCGVILPDSETILTYNNNYQYNKGKGINKNLQLMQYTGLKDKNGKEIYEGDVLETTHTMVLPAWDGWGRDRPLQPGEKTQYQTDIEVYTVYYDSDRGEFRMKSKVGNSRNLYERKDCEVIGNVFMKMAY